VAKWRIAYVTKMTTSNVPQLGKKSGTLQNKKKVRRRKNRFVLLETKTGQNCEKGEGMRKGRGVIKRGSIAIHRGHTASNSNPSSGPSPEKKKEKPCCDRRGTGDEEVLESLECRGNEGGPPRKLEGASEWGHSPLISREKLYHERWENLSSSSSRRRERALFLEGSSKKTWSRGKPDPKKSPISEKKGQLRWGGTASSNLAGSPLPGSGESFHRSRQGLVAPRARKKTKEDKIFLASKKVQRESKRRKYWKKKGGRADIGKERISSKDIPQKLPCRKGGFPMRKDVLGGRKHRLEKKRHVRCLGLEV